MILGISQPTFFPWIGYFAFLDKIDKFIFLDDVQFEKRSWQQRNCIKLNGQKHYITIPVKSKDRYEQKILDVEILSNKYLELIKKKIFYSYKKSSYFDVYYKSICAILDKNFNNLSELNIELIKYFIDNLKIKIDLDYSSNYSLKLHKEDLIFELCKIEKCEQYITTIGSKNYLNNFNLIPNTNIKISYFEYVNYEYKQLGENFIPKLSIIDLLFNEGKNSINIIRKSFKLI